MGNIGTRIKVLRNQRRVTQKSLPETVGVHRSLISKIEKGHSVGSLQTLEKLASALGVNITALLSDQPVSVAGRMAKYKTGRNKS